MSTKQIKDLDFEISFFEDLVKSNPGYVDALIPLADAYTKRGLYEKGLDIDIKLSALFPIDPLVHYNLACSYSLLNKMDLAFSALEKAVKLRYKDFRWMDKDPDLENVRKDIRYAKIRMEKPYEKSFK